MDDNESGQKRKRVTIGADDMYSVFQRYTAPTVITLYQEIGKFCGEKIDWNEMVKTTKTGIKNAREYQMLWRHLAYKHPLEEKIEDGAEPLDDESDLETDVEATPSGSANMVAEARSCVKVLIDAGPPSESSMFNREKKAPQVGSNWKQYSGANFMWSKNGQRHSNEQVANANNALSVALDRTVNLKACSVGAGSSSSSVQAITCGPFKDQSPLTKPPVPVRSSVSSHLVLQAAAMAAGARIGTPETAESLLKAAHANNAVHIMHGGGPVIKSGNLSPLPSSHLVAPHHGGAGLVAATHTNSSSALKVNSPVPLIRVSHSNITAADKPSPGAAESIKHKEVVNEACENSSKKQSQRVEDQSYVADNPKEGCYQDIDGTETRLPSMPSENENE